MRVVGVEKIYKFINKHTDAANWLKAWLAEARSANWQSPQEIKDRYSSASFVENNIIIFNVKGNKYRLEAQVAYHTKVVAIKRIGTHSEYDKWKKEG